ncbi:MAG: hypothetical protein ABI822_20680 [Bryobacteraceae bacterium]
MPPEIAERFVRQARERGVSLDAYVQEFLAISPHAHSEPPTLSDDELNRILDEAADIVPSGIVLSDYAISRESIYTREDEW